MFNCLHSHIEMFFIASARLVLRGVSKSKAPFRSER